MHHHILSLTIHSSFHITRFSALFFLRWIINLFKVIFGLKAMGERSDRDFRHWLLRTMLKCAWCYVRMLHIEFLCKRLKNSQSGISSFSHNFSVFMKIQKKKSINFFEKEVLDTFQSHSPESDGAFIIRLCVMARGRERVKNEKMLLWRNALCSQDGRSDMTEVPPRQLISFPSTLYNL